MKSVYGRREGISMGISAYNKFKTTVNTRAIRDDESVYIDMIEYMGTNIHTYDRHSYVNKVDSLMGAVYSSEMKNIMVCLGGSNDALYEMMGVLENRQGVSVDSILKISPFLSRCERSDYMNNSNYISYMSEESRRKIVHCGVVGYMNSTIERDKVMSEDGGKIVYMDDGVQGVSAAIDSIGADGRVCLHLDCESISSYILPGVSSINMTGFTLQDIHSIIDRLRGVYMPLIIISNFNPSVDSSMSIQVVSSILYHILHTIRILK